MNDSTVSQSNPEGNVSTAGASEKHDGFTSEQMHSALFTQMVVQQSSLAMMLLGRTPHPETGQPVRDLDAAKLFIDQLEMLEAKTKGNLDAQETALLKQSLMTLRLAFVEAVNSPEQQVKPAESTTGTGSDSSAAQKESAPMENTGAVGEEESKKRFSKKYSA